jgi:hypothetical protein
MKGALAAYISAVEALQNAGVELKGDVMIAGVVGEIEKTQVDQYRGPQYRGYGTEQLPRHTRRRTDFAYSGADRLGSAAPSSALSGARYP